MEGWYGRKDGWMGLLRDVGLLTSVFDEHEIRSFLLILAGQLASPVSSCLVLSCLVSSRLLRLHLRVRRSPRTISYHIWPEQAGQKERTKERKKERARVIASSSSSNAG